MKIYIFLAGLFLAATLLFDNFLHIGSVNISMAESEIELPLALAVGLLIMFFILSVSVFMILSKFKSIIKMFFLTALNKNPELSIQIFNKAISEDLKGNYRQSAKLFAKSSKASSYPVNSLIRAAEAANNNNDYKLRDDYIDQAYKVDINSIDLINFSLAKMYAHEKNYSKAIGVLDLIKQKNVNTNEYLKLKINLFDKVDDYAGLKDLISSISNKNILDIETLNNLRIKVYLYQVDTIDESNYKKLTSIWNKFPITAKSNSEVMRAYIYKIIELGFADNLINFVDKNIDLTQLRYIVDIVSKVTTIDNVKKISLIEKAINKDATSYQLFFWLGNLYFENRNWQKAKQMFEKSLKMHPTPLAFAAMARLAVVSGDEKSKIENIERGLYYLEESSVK